MELINKAVAWAKANKSLAIILGFIVIGIGAQLLGLN
jgi:hypothetical protein